MIRLFDLRDKEWDVKRLEFGDGVDILLNDEQGDVIHLILTHAQAERLMPVPAAREMDK